jgi:hypothetical protein
LLIGTWAGEVGRVTEEEVARRRGREARISRKGRRAAGEPAKEKVEKEEEGEIEKMRWDERGA